jgi:hypothetical protein
MMIEFGNDHTKAGMALNRTVGDNSRQRKRFKMRTEKVAVLGILDVHIAVDLVNQALLGTRIKVLE